MNSIKYWIALERVQGIGPATLKEIYKKILPLGLSLSDLFGLSISELRSEFNFNEKVASAFIEAESFMEQVDNEYMDILDAHIEVIPFFSKDYPERLHKLLGNNIPPFLYVFGNKNILKIPGAAILGERTISERGELISYMAAKELSVKKINIVTGLAKGAGLAATRGALETGGVTTAFVPYGILKLQIPDFLKDIYNPSLMLCISIFPPNAEADQFSAYIRNRVICAFSYAVYIVEAPQDGGIFEAAKSAHSLKVPLYTTEYADYPESAIGNKSIMTDFGAHPVRGKRVDDITVPNVDKIIADVKFSQV